MATNKAPLGRRSVPSAPIDRRTLPHRPWGPKAGELTPNHLEIIKWIMDGKRTEEIGQLMQMRPASVQQHIYRIMEITGTNTRVAVVVYALRRQLVVLPPLIQDAFVINHINGAMPKPIA